MPDRTTHGFIWKAQLSGAELEYAIAPEFRPVRVPIPLSRLSATLVEGRVPFDFSGKATDGQTIRLRLRVFISVDPFQLEVSFRAKENPRSGRGAGVLSSVFLQTLKL